MYRKIIFISINLLTLTSFAKVTILLMIAGLAFVLTYFAQPFNYRELNKIEEYSLLSAMATLFSGALYVCDVNDILKAISFSAIILVNIAFIITWFFSLTNVVFQSHLGKLQEYFPKFTYSIVACIIALEKTKKSLNICHYFKEAKQNFSKIRTDIITTYEERDSSFLTVAEKKGSILKSKMSKASNTLSPIGRKEIKTKVINIK